MGRFTWLVSGVAGLLLAGCAGLMSNEIHVSENSAAPNALQAKSLATVRFAGYSDGRGVGNLRKIGVAEARVSGMTGRDIMLDRDVTEVVADSLRKRLEGKGIQVVGKDEPGAQFELGGVIKALSFDVKARDYVDIKLATTLKDVASGKVVWAGEVEQKVGRFAGVSGNNKGDIADYLSEQLGIVTGKTAEAVSSELMATRPDLFNLTPGTKVIPGVTVFRTPGVTSPEGADVSMQKPMHEGEGRLVVRTEPAGAKVYVDGVYQGLSPLSIQYAAGVRTVEVRKKGYRSASEKVAVRLGDTTELEVQLEK